MDTDRVLAGTGQELARMDQVLVGLGGLQAGTGQELAGEFW